VDRCARGARFSPHGECAHVVLSLVFFVVAIIAAIFGFAASRRARRSIAKILFLVSCAFILSLLFGLSRGRADAEV